MERYLIHAAAFISLCVCAHAEPPQQKMKSNLRYDAAKEKTYNGKLVSIREKSLDGNGSDITDYVFLMIQRSDTGKLIECALGPAWKVAYFVKFEKSEPLSVIGVMSDYSQLLVRQVTSKTGTLTLRDARGKGVWDTSPESQTDSHIGGPKGGSGGPGGGGPGGGGPGGGAGGGMPNMR